MEIELSWPSWLQKVVPIIFVTILLFSTNQQILVSSMLPTDNRQIPNTFNLSSLLIPEVEASNLTNFLEKGQATNIPTSKYLKVHIPESQFLENLNQETLTLKNYENDTLRREFLYDVVTDIALQMEDNAHLGSADEPLAISVLNMILTRDEVTNEDNPIVYNETFWLSLDCDDFWKLTPPPNFIEFIPPPPIPPFLREHEITFREAKMEMEVKNNILNEEEILNEIIFDDQFCSLCSWANEALNLTAAVTDVPKKDTKIGVSHVMVGILVGVAFLSAVIGAAVMGVFLKCRKRESTSMERGFCPLVVRRRWLNSSFQKNRPCNSALGNNESSIDDLHGSRVANDQTMRGISLGMTRSTSTSPLQTTSPDSENSGQSEDHYISAETSSSVVYAELASNNQNHHYSEIENIYHLPNLVNNAQENFGEETYENFGYILPEISSVSNADGSPLYSSSAYYSDISSNGICVVNNSRNRRKRKRNVKFSSEKIDSFTNSCTACTQPRNQCQSYSPENQQTISKTYDNKINNALKQCQEVPLQNRPNLETTFPLHKHSEGIYKVHLNAFRGAPSFSRFPSSNNNDDSLWHVYELQTLRGSNPAARRSLPPLPKSRVPNSYRKHLRNFHPHRISSVPSEYI